MPSIRAAVGLVSHPGAGLPFRSGAQAEVHRRHVGDAPSAVLGRSAGGVLPSAARGGEGHGRRPGPLQHDVALGVVVRRPPCPGRRHPGDGHADLLQPHAPGAVGPLRRDLRQSLCHGEGSICVRAPHGVPRAHQQPCQRCQLRPDHWFCSRYLADALQRHHDAGALLQARNVEGPGQGYGKPRGDAFHQHGGPVPLPVPARGLHQHRRAVLQPRFDAAHVSAPGAYGDGDPRRQSAGEGAAGVGGALLQGAAAEQLGGGQPLGPVGGRQRGWSPARGGVTASGAGGAGRRGSAQQRHGQMR
mmetsp:Transcript_13490/g.39387  ORF Transcript_13490/g.39387 Transcript_13490/m.39387 type:complete len:302 (+) Transcript_13490:572-1477(+)